ncbi:Outer membrane protein assembly factor BamB [Candidatus Providencia siddallii]|uniref:Outer membrane protein assembly factor BamB n=1 Tax=Candidatus Providencia siddallii TaxID=1715285 RepID=A0A0M6W863_9GAMM|nr:Outer membrane protein assembly factor BamB [Candidatus Providencia siddallii]
MRLYIFILVLLTSLIFFVGCISIQKTNNVSLLPKTKNLFTPIIVWDKKIGSGTKNFYSKLSPAYENLIVYAADRNGLVKALKIDNGKEIWISDLSSHNCFLCSKTSAFLSGGIKVFNDKVFISTERGVLFALNKTNGKVIWTTDIDGEGLSKPVVSNDLVIIHTNSGQLQAIDINDGEIKWSLNIGTPFISLRGVSSPTISFGTLIIGGDNGIVTSVLMPQGQIIWQKQISQITTTNEIAKINDIDVTPIVDYDRIYIVSYNNVLSALDIYSGKSIWKREISSVNDMIISGENIFLIDINDRIFSIRKTDGVILWTKENLLNRGLSEAEIFNGYLVFGDKKGYLHWLDITDGESVAQNKLDSSGIQSRPVVAFDNLIVQAINGNLYLLKI